jgi:hypothetical protein
VITKVNIEAELLLRMCTCSHSFHTCIHSYIQVSNHVQVLLCFHGLRFVLRHGKAADDHKGWANQTYMNVTESLVPDGLKLFKERSASAARCVAVLVGNGGLVTWYSKGSGQYTEYSVDIGKQECSCGLWALYKYPCACAIAVAMKQGLVPERFVQANCHSSYYLCVQALEDIARRLKTILAPTTEELRMVRNSYMSISSSRRFSSC